MSKEKLSMQQIIYNFGLMFNQQPTSERIEIYADVLLPLGEDVVKLAFERIIRSGSAFFPSVAEIYEAINPKKPDVSAIVANEIIKLLRIYGPHAEQDLIKNASPLAKSVLVHIGSTESLRASENTDMIRAQLERLAKSISQKMEYESNQSQNVIDFKSQGLRKKIMNF
jgi:hypothetical protein